MYGLEVAAEHEGQAEKKRHALPYGYGPLPASSFVCLHHNPVQHLIVLHCMALYGQKSCRILIRINSSSQNHDLSGRTDCTSPATMTFKNSLRLHCDQFWPRAHAPTDRKRTRLNSSH